MEQLIISNTVNNIKKAFNSIDIDYDKFIDELKKNNAVIAGSFMFMNFAFVRDGKNFLGAKYEFNDIDIYVQTNFNNEITSNDAVISLPPLEEYIKSITKKHVETDSYIFTDGIVLSRTFATASTKINVITTSGPPIKFINENFDLDCCKIIFDGTTCQVHNIEDLCKGITKARYNKCTLDHIYRDFEVGICEPTYLILRKSEAFNKFIRLYEAYKGTINPLLKKNYKRYLRYISNKFDLDKIFGSKSLPDIKSIPITNEIVQIISMIRTHERIDKYKSRGIISVELDVGNILI